MTLAEAKAFLEEVRLNPKLGIDQPEKLKKALSIVTASIWKKQ